MAYFAIILAMNNKHRKMLSIIFTNSVSRNLEWKRIESLFMAIGCELIEGRGSRVAFKMHGLRVDFHHPHPRKEAKPYQVRIAREFLEKMEIKP